MSKHIRLACAFGAGMGTVMTWSAFDSGEYVAEAIAAVLVVLLLIPTLAEPDDHHTRIHKMNQTAPVGQVFVCSACGKRSRDIYGEQKISRGWDESCAMHAVLCDEATLVFENGLVVSAKAMKGKDGKA